MQISTRPPLSPLQTRRRSDARRFMARHGSERQFTARAVLVGVFVGTIVNFSNMYFGLQTGWVSMMSMPSSLIGFAMFRSCAAYLKSPFTPVENVLLQTVAVAVGSMPLSAGFVGVIPALEKLLKPSEGGPLKLSITQQVVWSLGVAFFGVFFAVPLRRQVLIREKLKFPSGTATALMISLLHGGQGGVESDDIGERGLLVSTADTTDVTGELGGDRYEAGDKESWKQKTRLLVYSFAISGIYTLLSYFFPILRDVPIFGSTAAKAWLWTLNPSPAYVGQGIIMGTSTTLHMLLGAVIGWGILSPLAHHKGWAPGPTDDWVAGGRGWVIWVSLGIMLSDSVVSLGWLLLSPVVGALRRGSAEAGHDEGYERLPGEESTAVIATPTWGLRRRRGRSEDSGDQEEEEEEEEDMPKEHLVPMSVVVGGIVASGLLCTIAIKLVFGVIPLSSIAIAFVLSILLCVMGVRALGQTDLNPVSGISKLTQLFFALITSSTFPWAIVTNLVAGGVSEAGAQQAGDMMQDLKTGHLLGASPRAQFYGQLIGASVGAVLSPLVYRLYTSVYPVPGPLFQVPTAYVWIDCSRLVFGEGLPPHVRPVAAGFAAIFAALSVARTSAPGNATAWIPGGIAVAVGMYNTPSFTLARAVGGLVHWNWDGEETKLIVIASGLILGEGVCSIVNLAMASMGVPHW